MKRTSQEYTIFSAQAATGTGKSIFVEDFRNASLSFGTATSANLTVKFQGSIQDTAPDFTAAQSVSNQWDYIEIVDLQSGAAIDGDTGVAVAGTDDFRLFEANINGLKWINATVTARSAGSVTIKARLFDNQ